MDPNEFGCPSVGSPFPRIRTTQSDVAPTFMHTNGSIYCNRFVLALELYPLYAERPISVCRVGY